MAERDVHLSTKVIHAGQSPEPVTGAVMPPVFQTSTYAQPRPAQHTGYEYSRSQNPTREALERCVAGLEGGADAIAFGSGLAATTSLLLTLPQGARVVASDDLYGGTYRLFERVMTQRDLSFSYADFSIADPAVAIPDGTAMVWIETPTNPLLKVTDLAAVAARCREIGAQFAVDNTFATPIFQRPLALGAHYVVHSMTKYLNGHSDVVGGIVVAGTEALGEPVRFVQNSVGGVPGPWDAWLALRGLKTLAVRMDRHQQNGRAIVAWLLEQPRVKRMHYPMLESDPGYAVASKQMDGFGGMVSFVLDATLAEAEDVVSNTKLFTLAESLGGVESLIELPASMTHASVPPAQRATLGIDDGLVRLSVGIEHVDDLIADLDQAFAASLR